MYQKQNNLIDYLNARNITVLWPEEYDMANNEFSKVFPPSIARMQWPLTFDRRGKTHIGGTGTTAFYRTPSPRDVLLDGLEAIYGTSPEARDRTSQLMERAEFFGGTPLGAYDATTAISEGRYKDAIVPVIAIVAPWVRKFKSAAKEFPDTNIGGEAGDLTKARDPASADTLETRAPQTSHEKSVPDSQLQESRLPQSAAPTKSDLTAPSLILPDTSLVVPSPHIIRPFGRDVLESRRGDSFKPNFFPYPRPLTESEVSFTLPRHWKQRSSPWVAQFPPMTTGRRRPFRLDYPKDPPTDAQGRILFDLEGRPLTAKYIAGRNELGKPDRALTLTEKLSIIKNDLGLDLVSKPKDYFEPRTIGHLSIDPKDGRLAEIAVWNELPADQEFATIAHEMGHGLDWIAGELSLSRFDDELIPLYSAHSTGRIGPPYLLPENRGYRNLYPARERAAEAFRIYSTGPDTMKRMAPKAAAAMRELNDHPFFKKVIQFNGLPIGVPVGAGVATAATIGLTAGSDDASAAPSQRASPVDYRGSYEKTEPDQGLASIRDALSRRGRDVPTRQRDIFKDIVQTLTQLRRDPKIYRNGGPR